ncbi:MAG: hypothetical protein WB421_13510, partial [Terriglobales bacterium]
MTKSRRDSKKAPAAPRNEIFTDEEIHTTLFPAIQKKHTWVTQDKIGSRKFFAQRSGVKIYMKPKQD